MATNPESPPTAVTAATPEVTEPQAGRIFMTGGTGFVGSNVRAALAGRPLRLLVRNPARYRHLESETVELAEGDVLEPETLADAMAGCEAVIHLVAIIEESGDATFDRVIRGGTENVVKAAQATGIKRLLHMSALGAQDNPRFPYLKAKWDAEQIVMASGIPWTIFRPSVVFGPGDGFINPLAGIVKWPVTPVVGDGQSKFMPVSVKDVADAFVRALDDPSTIGQIYELGGARIYTFEQMLDVIGQRLGKRRPRVKVPVALMKPVVTLSKPLPKPLRPPVTTEQLNMLALDNTTDRSATKQLIGRDPLALEDGIDYLLPGAVNRPPA